ncbi:hypothetical protein AAMO2058_000272700 [Amorphochlora amoebiformis]
MIEKHTKVYKMKTEVEIERTLKIMKELLSESTGYLTAKQIETVLRKNEIYLTSAELRALLNKLDKNHDGRIVTIRNTRAGCIPDAKGVPQRAIPARRSETDKEWEPGLIGQNPFSDFL